MNHDHASPPGDTIAELLEERGIESSALASALGLTAHEFAQMLTGRMRIAIAMAEVLGRFFELSATFWYARDLQYVATCERLVLEVERTELAAVVRAIAGREPIDPEGGHCRYCDEHFVAEHAAWCAWRLAREWTERHR